MKIKIITLITFSFFLGLQSCKQCRTCTCSKGSLEYEEENCAIGTGTKKSLDTWEEYIIEQNNYDNCTCTDN
ncbi:MAG: hypothetical protein LRY27_01415 [Chitinophagales bacterium]|nr:hypothetical protein [Chitinophagales bacterium]